MNGFLHVLDNNESWDNLTRYIDFPDAGVPDCGMFIESYDSHLLMIDRNKASVRVQFYVAGEFAGIKYYRYPKAIRRDITYRFVYTNRSWSVIDESGITNYVPHYGSDYFWKIRTTEISFMNIRFMDWHMHYYSPHDPKQVLHGFPLKHCWVN